MSNLMSDSARDKASNHYDCFRLVNRVLWDSFKSCSFIFSFQGTGNDICTW